MSATVTKFPERTYRPNVAKVVGLLDPFGNEPSVQIDVARLAIVAIEKIREEPKPADEKQLQDRCQRMIDSVFLGMLALADALSIPREFTIGAIAEDADHHEEADVIEFPVGGEA